MIRMICRFADGRVEVDPPVEGLPRLLAARTNQVWVDMQGPSDSEYERVLAQVFHFHPLAIEDALSDCLLYTSRCV